MTKFIDNLGLKRLVTKIAEAVGNGTWLPVRKGEGEGSVVMGSDNNIASGEASYAEGSNCTASGRASHAEGSSCTASGEASHAEGESDAEGDCSHAEGSNCIAKGIASHAEGSGAIASGLYSHAEGNSTKASGSYSHAQGSYNYEDLSFIDMVGVGNNDSHTKNASVIYVGKDSDDYIDPSDPKNGYQYLLGVGGYQGQAIAEGMKSVQEVIADLEKGVAASETMTVEEIREIMSA